MKSYGQIDLEGRDAYFVEKGGDIFKTNPLSWNLATPLARGASEACAQAVIAEFCKRNNITIPPEED